MPRKPESKLPGLRCAKRIIEQHRISYFGDAWVTLGTAIAVLRAAIRREEAREKGRRQ